MGHRMIGGQDEMVKSPVPGVQRAVRLDERVAQVSEALKIEGNEPRSTLIPRLSQLVTFS
jgi:hypothetical protein